MRQGGRRHDHRAALHLRSRLEGRRRATPSGCRRRSTGCRRRTAAGAEVRLYDRLFTSERPGAGDTDFLTEINPDALEVLQRLRRRAEPRRRRAGDALPVRAPRLLRRRSRLDAPIAWSSTARSRCATSGRRSTRARSRSAPARSRTPDGGARESALATSARTTSRCARSPARARQRVDEHRAPAPRQSTSMSRVRSHVGGRRAARTACGPIGSRRSDAGADAVRVFVRRSSGRSACGRTGIVGRSR